MKYSSGAPSVFGSMIRFTLEKKQLHLEWRDWEPWFKIDVFWMYGSDFQFSDFRIQLQLAKLSESDWEPLMLILQNDGMLTESDVDTQCGVSVSSGKENMVNRLLRIGVIKKRMNGKLCLVSELMLRWKLYRCETSTMMRRSLILSSYCA